MLRVIFEICLVTVTKLVADVAERICLVYYVCRMLKKVLLLMICCSVRRARVLCPQIWLLNTRLGLGLLSIRLRGSLTSRARRCPVSRPVEGFLDLLDYSYLVQ